MDRKHNVSCSISEVYFTVCGKLAGRHKFFVVSICVTCMRFTPTAAEVEWMEW